MSRILTCFTVSKSIAVFSLSETHDDVTDRADTQPTRATFEQLIGGTLITSDKRVGGDAWGVMVVETRLEPPYSEHEAL